MVPGSKRKPNPIDLYVGTRIRLRRGVAGISQTELAEKVGITFQQIQKYEKGTNRVGASRLLEIANALGVSVDFFFEGVSTAEEDNKRELADATNLIIEFLSSSEGLQLNQAFVKIQNQVIRRSIIDIVKELAGSTD
ncbi:MAG: helix-turn-helix domain-containing protein [Cohaesibacter sp.]|jgi:transcriptional regulator with XRE-family HTH domain|nr:helix-turn-helix domain-containing protein [Cohaesibacter sp.]